MKKLSLTILCSLLVCFSFAQDDNKIILGTIDSVQSKILNENRKVWVYLPNGIQKESKQKYPVVYLLDGDAHFYSVVGMIQQLSQVNGNTICPEMIVIGIPNTDRTRDLTPTHVVADPPYMDSAFSKTSGGGENFVAFIEKELMPYIDSAYPTQPYKILIGHSLGGLTVMNVAANHTNLFNAYICLDPSMWWDKMNFLNTTRKVFSSKKFSGTALYLAIANTMDEGMDIIKVKNDTSIATKHIRSILDIDNHIKSLSKKDFRYASKYYNDDDHGSLPLVATYDALRFIFSKYRFVLTNKDYLDSNANLAAKLDLHYREVSTFFGYKVSPPEGMVNSLGYEFMNQKHYDKAAKMFEMNVDTYPESGNVYDSYADYFSAIGDKAKAIEYFKKALMVKENAETRKKLNKLLE